MNKNYLIIGLIVIALVVIGVIAARTAERPAVEDQVPPPATEERVMVPLIEVSDQVVTENSITVNRVYSETNGWIIVYRMAEDGVPDTTAHIGAATVRPGESRDVLVQLTGEVAEGAALVVILHHDTGVVGEYEFGPEATEVDVPVIVNGNPVAAAFRVVAPQAETTPEVNIEAGGEIRAE
jgi:hypothetical protein